jgi:hypothetical protein
MVLDIDQRILGAKFPLKGFSLCIKVEDISNEYWMQNSGQKMASVKGLIILTVSVFSKVALLRFQKALEKLPTPGGGIPRRGKRKRNCIYFKSQHKACGYYKISHLNVYAMALRMN